MAWPALRPLQRTGPPALSPCVIDVHGTASVRVRRGRYRVSKHLVSPPHYLLIKLGKLLIVPDGDPMGGKLQRLAGQVIPLRDVTPCPVNDRLQLGNHGPLEGVRGRPAVGVQGPLELRPQLALGARETATVTLYLPFLVRDNGCRHASVWPWVPFRVPRLRTPKLATCP